MIGLYTPHFSHHEPVTDWIEFFNLGYPVQVSPLAGPQLHNIGLTSGYSKPNPIIAALRVRAIIGQVIGNNSAALLTRVGLISPRDVLGVSWWLRFPIPLWSFTAFHPLQTTPPIMMIMRLCTRWTCCICSLLSSYSIRYCLESFQDG